MILSLVGTDVACILVPPPPRALRCLSFVCGISGCAGSSTAWEMFLGLNRSKRGSLENLQQAQEFVVVMLPEARGERPSEAGHLQLPCRHQKSGCTLSPGRGFWKHTTQQPLPS